MGDKSARAERADLTQHAGRPPTHRRPRAGIAAGILVAVVALMLLQPTHAEVRPSILVVMSYGVEHEWCRAIRRAIEERLGEAYELHFIYLNSRAQPHQITKKAASAYDRYLTLKPHGVIAVDDNAQSFFVVPYLRNQTETPVIFCGVNGAPEAYGYPCSNVTGVLERYHIKETLALLHQLVPGIQRVAFIGLDAPTGRLMLDQARDEAPGLALTETQFWAVATYEELLALTDRLHNEVDALYLSILRGIADKTGARPSDRDIIRTLTAVFQKPVVSAAFYDLPHGVLCSVVHTGEEQGRLAADLMRKALTGTPIAQLPITRNYNGRRIINVSALQALGIKPRPIQLRGAKLIRNDP
ncbi:MAG: ABC transporter substrate binding protein [Desulfosarcinaceae bacterium]|nr:ABC transporter substrate binding protein [Desulfosarcinaceae bacterium]